MADSFQQLQLVTDLRTEFPTPGRHGTQTVLFFGDSLTVIFVWSGRITM
jgi:hypothetical protein